MKIQIRNGTAIIEGYVNAVERFSKPLYDTRGKFIERIMPSVFQKALERNNDVLTLLNHDHEEVLARTKDGTAELIEDNIGLKARVQVSDETLIKKAKDGKLRGWSFGFIANKEERTVNEEGLEERTIRDLDLIEVSIIDDKKTPAYYGTSIEMRDNNTKIIEFRAEFDSDTELIDEDKSSESETKLTYNEKYELLRNGLREKVEDEAYMNDFDEENVYVNFYEENQVYKIPYKLNGDDVQFNFGNKIKVKMEYVEQRNDAYKYRNRLNRLKINKLIKNS